MMKPNSLCLTAVLGALLLVPTAVSARAADGETLASPDGLTQVTLAIRPAQGDSAPKRLCYSIRHRGKDVVVDSPLGLEFRGAPGWGDGVAIEKSGRRTVDENWQRVYGKRRQVRDQFNELSVVVQETAASKRRIEWVFRAYDDGVAFRYLLPESWGKFELVSENTAIRFPRDASVWAANYGGFHSSQEAQFRRMKLSELAAGQVYGCPLLLEIDPALWAACCEADLTDWAGMYFTPMQGEAYAVRTALSPHPDEPGVAVRSTARRSSPWRVIMVADRPGAFIESDLLENLNAPAAFDASWIKPGKCAWDIWWSANYGPELEFPLAMDTRSMKYFVDLAAEMGWPYQLVDASWYGPAFAPGAFNSTWAAHPTSSITNVIPELDLHELIRYAGRHGVRILVWLHWGHVDKQMDVAFPLYEKWGIAGVKIDFMDRDDQEMVNFYERVAKKAAEHHLLVDFHGAYKPTGWHRTYPNVITREGVMGNEYNKWSTNVTPEHVVTIPFTRGMLGAMDFTPGGFRQKSVETFRAVGGDAPGPFVMGTRVHQLAMLVVYESALQVLCDSPYCYRSSPAGTDFLKIVPTTWDDTKVLEGEVGRFITVARRAGRDWYLGSMSGTEGRVLQVPLGFLGTGEYEAEIWADAYEAADYPDRLMKRQRTVTAADTLRVTVAPAGGCVMRFRAR